MDEKPELKTEDRDTTEIFTAMRRYGGLTRGEITDRVGTQPGEEIIRRFTGGGIFEKIPGKEIDRNHEVFGFTRKAQNALENGKSLKELMASCRSRA